MSNFTIGQHVFIQSGQFRGDAAPKYTDAIVTKVLKTRVEVEYEIGNAKRTRRFVLNKYGVQNHLAEEGHAGDYYHHIYLMLDDQELANRRAAVEREAARTARISVVRNAATEFAGDRWPTAAAAQELIEKLQAFIAESE